MISYNYSLNFEHRRSLCCPLTALASAPIWICSFAHPFTQQTLFQGGALLRAATLVAGDALSHCNLPSDGPVGAAILAHPIYIADLAFCQGKMGAQGFRRSAGEQRALASAPAPMPQLLVLALTAADRVTEDQGFSAASAHDPLMPDSASSAASRWRSSSIFSCLIASLRIFCCSAISAA